MNEAEHIIGIRKKEEYLDHAEKLMFQFVKIRQEVLNDHPNFSDEEAELYLKNKLKNRT